MRERSGTTPGATEMGFRGDRERQTEGVRQQCGHEHAGGDGLPGVAPDPYAVGLGPIGLDVRWLPRTLAESSDADKTSCAPSARHAHCAADPVIGLVSHESRRRRALRRPGAVVGGARHAGKHARDSGSVGQRGLGQLDALATGSATSL